jgi:catechol 2,3-dioxygenase-like lactoylglutathione lyase family enzyme
MTLRIKLTSVLVQDQEKALTFYTDVLGFRTKHDIPMGEARWLTVVSPQTDEIELLLEPLGHPAAAPFQKALYDSGVPLTALFTDDIDSEYERLKARGVAFRSPPAQAGPAKVAMFDDTCGNLIQLVQAPA